MINKLTILEFSSDADFDKAKKLCSKLGFRDSWAYTSSSVPGMYCIPLRASQNQKIIVKTEELGFIVIDDIDTE